MPEKYSEERTLIREKFEQLANNIIADSDFEFEVKNIEVFERQSMTGASMDIVFSIQVKTNNRAQLLGQMHPFEQGGYSGHFVNLYRGHIIEEIEDQFDPEYRFFIEVNAVQVDPSTEYLDRHLSLNEAIDDGLVPSDSPLAEKMREYDLETLILAGGTIITGPLASGIETMERVFENHDIKTVLDMFAGSGAYSKVALTHGAEHIDTIDINIEAAEANLEDVPQVTLHEMDAFDFSPDRNYDLVIADPYYELSKPFIEKKVPELTVHCDYYFQTTAFVGDTYWRKNIREKLENHFETLTEYNTGRMYQVLGET